MNDRRLVGIDLGIASAHSVRVLDGEGDTIAKRKVLPTVESLTGLEDVALAGTAAGTRLEVVWRRVPSSPSATAGRDGGDVFFAPAGAMPGSHRCPLRSLR